VLCWQVYNRVVLDPLEEAAIEALKDMDKSVQKEIEEDDRPLFVPFPGTTKQVTPRPYRGSDPEWQEYIKFSKNQALGKRVRG
jgi:hypothetical protein